MKALWIFLAVVGIIGLLLLLPIWLYVEYAGDEPRVHVGYGPIRVQLLPKRRKKKNRKKQKKQEAVEPTPPPKEKRTVQSVYASAKQYLPLVKTVLGMIPSTLRAVVIDELRVYVKLNDDDPADLALHYGQAWAAIGWLVAAISNLFQLKRQDVRPVVDSQCEGFTLEASVKVHLTLWKICGLGLKFLKRYLQQRKQAAANNPDKGVQL